MFYSLVPILLLLGFASCPAQEIAKWDAKTSDGIAPVAGADASNFAAPQSCTTATNFGQVTSTTNGGRNIQLGLRLSF
jgi:hypothetical protein